MSAVDDIRKFIKALRDGGAKDVELKRLEAPAALVAELKEELQLGPDDPVVVDGLPVVAQSPRDQQLGRAMMYAYYRWKVSMSKKDVEHLFKAVGDDELEALAPIIIDQHLDDHGYADPVDEMDAAEVKFVEEQLKALGYVDVAL